MRTLGSLAWPLVLVLGGPGGCTRNGSPEAVVVHDEVVYECRDPAVLHAGEGKGYRIEIDGADPRTSLVSMVGRPASPAAGDVVHVGDLAVVLDGPGHYRFSYVEESRRAMLSLDGAPPRLVALAVADASELAALTPAEREGLRGVRLRAWSEALAAELARLDLERVAVAYDPNASGRAEIPLVPPGLPPAVRLLELEIRSMTRPGRTSPLDDPQTGLRALSGLPRLRYLSLVEAIHSPHDGPELDLEHLRGLGALEHLRLYSSSRRIVHMEALAALGELRALDLGGGEGLGELEPLASLSKLRQLDIGGTDVTSLAALSGHPSLEVIDASASKVAVLPGEPPPALRELVLLGTPTTASEATAFAARAPAARVSLGWNQALAHSIACADRIRVRSGGLCHRDVASEQTLADVRDPAEVAAALPLFHIREDDPMGACMCCGEPTIELWRGEQLVAAVGFHHGRSLRWHGWPGDGAMAPADAAALCRWLVQHGATEACTEPSGMPEPQP